MTRNIKRKSRIVGMAVLAMLALTVVVGSFGVQEVRMTQQNAAMVEQLFGIDIMAIREIRAWTPVTKLPRLPHYVAGVVNLRGTVLPVVNLAARLGWQVTEATPRHAIIVTQVGGQARGLILDLDKLNADEIVAEAA